MKKISVLFSLLGSFAFAAQEADSGSKLKGVLVVDDSSKLKTENIDQIKGVQLDGVEKDLKAELSSFIADLSLTEEGVKQLCDAISSHYRENQDLRVAVSAPEKDVNAGVVQLVVAPERLGEVKVKDNKFTEADTLKKWVRLGKRDPINEKTLAQDVGWMNTNPFRSVKVGYQAGERDGVTNVDLIVNDKKNWKVFSGVDNTGTNPIGPIRIFAGFNVNNFIFEDHTLNVQYTTADHFKEYRGATIQYTAPLPWRNTLRVFGSYTGTAPNRSDFPQKHRESYQASTRYAIPYWFGSNLWIDQITVDVGADFKGTNTNILFEDDAAPVEKRLAYVGQFTSSVSAIRARGSNKITALAEIIGSPARMLPHQTEEDFNNLRQGSTPRYAYSRLAITMDQALPADWKVFFQGRGQFSVSNLIPSEQFSLGGYSTVRGYDERVVNGDNAVCGNLELRSPALPVVAIWMPKAGDSLSLLGFVDGGYAWYREVVADTPTAQTLLGAGAGFRYNVASYFTSRFDVGYPLMSVEKDSGKPHIHFNAILSY
jgi:hemolysin activation/secretion protein